MKRLEAVPGLQNEQDAVHLEVQALLNWLQMPQTQDLKCHRVYSVTGIPVSMLGRGRLVGL